MKKLIHLRYLSLLSLLFFLGTISSCSDDEENLSNLTGLTSFSIKDQPANFVIDQDALTVTNGTDSLPFETDVSALVAVFEAIPNATVTVNGTEQESGTTVNDFSSPVTYTVTAQDGITIKDYEVKINVSQLDPETVAWNRIAAEAEWGPFEVTNGTYFDGKLWVFGYTHAGFGPPTKAETYNSTDGVSWTKVDARDDQYNYTLDEEGFPTPGTRRPAIVSHNDKLFLIAGYLNGREDSEGGTPFADPTNKVWSSSDGLSWSITAPVDAFSPRERSHAVSLNDKIYLIGGNGAGFFGALGAPMHDVWSSADGVTWTEEVTNAAFEPRTDPAVFVHDGKIWLIGGKDVSGAYLNDIWTSTDGATWEQVITESDYPGRMGHTATVIQDKLVIIGGEGLNDAEEVVQNNDMWVSEDGGVNWRLTTEEDPYSIPSSFIGRSNHSTFSDADGNIYILGGVGPNNGEGFATYPRDVWRGKGVQ